MKAKKRTKSKVTYVHLGDVAVDTGMLTIADPCRASEISSQCGEVSDSRMNHGALGLCVRDKNDIGIGVNFTTGIGDGLYPVLATEEEIPGWGRRITSVFIPFDNPFRGKGCWREFPHKELKTCFDGETKINDIVAEFKEGA